MNQNLMWSCYMSLEKELDALIERDPAFGEWYFSKEENMVLPRDAYERYQYKLTSEAFKHKMIMRKNGWDDEYLKREMQRIQKSVSSQRDTRGFGENDYVRYFKGFTDYTQARDIIRTYKELCEAVPSSDPNLRSN